MMKRILRTAALLLAMTVAVSAFAAADGLPSDKAAGVTLIEGYEWGSVGDSLHGSKAWFDGGSVKITDEAHGAGSHSVKITNATRAEWGCAYLYLNDGCFTDKDGLLFYAKYADNTAGDTNVLRVNLAGDTLGYKTRDDGSTGITYQYLPNGSSEWQTATDAWGQFTLPDNFEGYIKIGFDQYVPSWGTGDPISTNLSLLKQIDVWMAVYGGMAGDGVTEAAVFIDDISAYDGTGSDTPGEISLPQAMGVSDLYMLEGFDSYILPKGTYPITDGMDMTDIGKVGPFGGGTATAGTGQVVSGSFSLKLDNTDRTGWSSAPLYFPQGSLSGKTAVLFHVKMPNNPDSDYNSINPCIAGNTGGYKLQDVGTCRIWRDGGTGWEDYPITYGLAQLPSNYRGYVCIGLDQYVKNFGDVPDAIADGLAYLNNINLYIEVVGGYNPLYMDLIMAADSTYTGNAPKDAPGLTVLEDYEEYTVVSDTAKRLNKGDDLAAKKGIRAFDGTVTAAGEYRSTGSCAARFSASEKKTWAVTEIPFTRGAMAGRKGLIFYVKMPAYSSGEEIALNALLADTTDGHIGDYKCADNAAYQVMASGSGSWEDRTCAYGEIRLPAGFEGYVRIPLEGYIYNSGAVPAAATDGMQYPDTLKVWISAVGGEQGDWYLDDVMVYGDGYDGTIHQEIAVELAAADAGVYVVEDFSGYEAGDDLDAAGVTVSLNGGGTVGAASDEFSGRGRPAAKISRRELTDGWINAAVHFGTNTLNDKEGMILYLKMPESGGGANELNLCLESLSLAGGYKFRSNSTVQILEKEDTGWRALPMSGDVAALPDGFEGYLKVSFADNYVVNYGGVPTDIRDALPQVSFFSIWLRAIGGQNAAGGDNALYVDDILVYGEDYADTFAFLPEDWAARSSSGEDPDPYRPGGEEDQPQTDDPDSGDPDPGRESVDTGDSLPIAAMLWMLAAMCVGVLTFRKRRIG